jgi:hypothetical protein
VHCFELSSAQLQHITVLRLPFCATFRLGAGLTDTDVSKVHTAFIVKEKAIVEESGNQFPLPKYVWQEYSEFYRGIQTWISNTYLWVRSVTTLNKFLQVELVKITNFLKDLSQVRPLLHFILRISVRGNTASV